MATNIISKATKIILLYLFYSTCKSFSSISKNLEKDEVEAK